MESLHKRCRKRNDKEVAAGPVLYWMQRDARVADNWALAYAQEQAITRHVPLLVLFCFPPSHPLDTLRIHHFQIEGLKEVAQELKKLQIPFLAVQGVPDTVVSDFVKKHEIGEVVGDFNPIRYQNRYRERLAKKLDISYCEVDARNSIPCWLASDKEEFAAHTFRPKVHRALKQWLVDIPVIKKHTYTVEQTMPTTDWNALYDIDTIDRTVEPVDWLKPGTTAGLDRLQTFIDTTLASYDEKRNDPNADGISHLSPYLRHGQISSARVALAVQAAKAPTQAKEAYLEELIVRRELTDNYCFYNKNYDNVSGAHDWAQKTIAEHAEDPREYEYTKAQLEGAHTHDELWNAMQIQMVQEGKMHGWCRMYWAKKILEWTPDVQTAIDIALDLNDKYELDGNDPNGVVGVMWSMCGVHDRAWTERPVFGKIRYMNYNGARRKFDVDQYVQKYTADTDTLFDD